MFLCVISSNINDNNGMNNNFEQFSKSAVIKYFYNQMNRHFVGVTDKLDTVKLDNVNSQIRGIQDAFGVSDFYWCNGFYIESSHDIREFFIYSSGPIAGDFIYSQYKEKINPLLVERKNIINDLDKAKVKSFNNLINHIPFEVIIDFFEKNLSTYEECKKLKEVDYKKDDKEKLKAFYLIQELLSLLNQEMKNPFMF